MTVKVGPGFPSAGCEWSEIVAMLDAARCNDLPWRSGRTTRAAFFVSAELEERSREAFDMFFGENALLMSRFPSLIRFEAELIAMTLDLLAASNDADGIFTSGGTESIFLACLAAREAFRNTHGDAVEPEIVVPFSAHPAFDKAAFYLRMRVKRVELTGEYRADISAMEKAVGKATAMLVGSAPCWPHGTIDPIDELSALAQRGGHWLHVDACMGGFLLPFYKDAGYPAAPHLLSGGIRSVSVDFHKYAHSAKGASAVLFASRADRARAAFQFSGWSGSNYTTSGFLGTRTGGALASAWAITRHLGTEGYVELVRTVMELRDRLVSHIESIPELELLGQPVSPLLSFRGRSVPTGSIAAGLEKRGWIVTRILNPDAIHVILNPVHGPTMAAYLADLSASVADAAAGASPVASGDVGYS